MICLIGTEKHIGSGTGAENIYWTVYWTTVPTEASTEDIMVLLRYVRGAFVVARSVTVFVFLGAALVSISAFVRLHTILIERKSELP